jgi:hypothetical protein
MLIPLDVRFFPILESFGMIPRNRIAWARQHGLHARRKFSCRYETILWFTKSDQYTFNLDAIRVPQKYQDKKYHKGDKHGELSCHPDGKNPADIWLFPRRSARMTHFRSLKLTHTKNTICRGATGGSSNLIHAEGVRGDFSSSAPKARKGLRLQEETAGAGDRIDRQGSRASPHSICRAARMRSCKAAKHHPTGRGGGSLLASKVGSFLASAEGLFRNVKHNHEEQTIHPCQFPEDLIARIVLSTTNAGDVVFDPYMGVGTVAVVARDHDRHFLGAELDPIYHSVALRRLAGEPDERNSFPNLKTLRDYVERTGKPIEKYRFDVQVGDFPTDRSKAKIYPEEHHLREMFERVSYEEEAFGADLRDHERPVDHKLNGGAKKRPSKITSPSLFDGLQGES